MVQIHISELIMAFQESNILWIIIPIFFIGVTTDKYQEEFGTSVGNAISNGALIIFTGFSWLQMISSRGPSFPIDISLSQIFLTVFIIAYGFSIVASGFRTGEFARVYGRIRVVTFMLIFFTMIIYIPLMYNFVSIVLFVLLFPFYYAFITELVKVLPSTGSTAFASSKSIYRVTPPHKKSAPVSLSSNSRSFLYIGREKILEYLR